MAVRDVYTDLDFPSIERFRPSGDVVTHHNYISYTTTIDSSGHKGWRNPSPMSDVGGPFALHKHHLFIQPTKATMGQGSNHEEECYVLPGVIPRHDGEFPRVTYSSDDALFARGGTSISRMVPTRSRADLAAFLGELHEGLPHAARLANSGKARAVASQYVGYEFGWKPLFNDIHTFVRNTRNADALWETYKKNSGVVEHRSLPIFETQDVDRYQVTNSRAWPEPASLGAFGGDLDVTTISTRKSWCEGAFVYWVPDPGLQSDYRRADYIYGIDLNPDTIWELTPWSWAADWVVNVGDVLTNMDAFSKDGLVMPYCYIMEQVETKMVANLTNIYCSADPSLHPSPSSITATTKHCRRVAASPFGFGIDWDGFSDRQLAIAAALGLTRTGH